MIGPFSMQSFDQTTLVNNDEGAALEGIDVKSYAVSSAFQSTFGECDARQVFDAYKSPETINGAMNESGITSQGSLSDSEFCHPSTSPHSFQPLSRRFWSAGDYESGHDRRQVSQKGQNRLRVHPKFLHSNATSHKWAFGALAELLDNAVDEIQNGATFVIIDKITYPHTENPALLIQDDGGGMDPEALRRCMSFGFSDKQSSSIGQYGNGFKTSTMRLGADVIVFSRCINKRTLTQSVGLLSYTFLRQTGADDIVVPMVDYKFDPVSGVFARLLRHGQKEFSANLSTLLKWSPFDTETELLNQFNDIGHHGTKIVVFNLWYNDDGIMELDFESDPEDIMIRGAPILATNNNVKMLNHNHIANRLRYSLRVYSSVLYLHRPETFNIILRGRVVECHHFAKDLKYIQCIMYRPQVGGRIEGEVVTTVGFLEGAPLVNIHGFNIYHKNRLILPFCQVISVASSKGRGVSGVLEANFIKPTHDKQGFERSTIYQKLESRLKEMTYEYWDFHCHLIGYWKKPPQSTPAAIATTPQQPHLSCSIGPSSVSNPSYVPSGCPSSTLSKHGELVSNYNPNSQADLIGKRRHEGHSAANKLKRQMLASGIATMGTNQIKEFGSDIEERPAQHVITMMKENKKLREECLQYEKTENDLLTKVQKLRQELEEVECFSEYLSMEIEAIGAVKSEKPPNI